MRILVYGAGVLGSLLAHYLVKGGNDVTMLARGSRVDELKQNGIIIRHYLQFKTTVDPTKVVTVLQPDDVYDLIFVVMTYADIRAVLPILAANHSHHIVLVGNNPDGHAMQKYLVENSPVEKRIAFGFQLSGGRRERGRIIALGAGGGIEIGDLNGNLSWRPLIEKAFEAAPYKLAFREDMDAWLKSHMIPVLAIHYMTHAGDGDLRRSTGDKKLRNLMVSAVDEGFKVLETLGYPITPASQAHFIRNRYCIVAWFLRIYAITPFNKLMDVMSQYEEMSALNTTFEALKKKADILTPNWDALARYSPNL